MLELVELINKWELINFIQKKRRRRKWELIKTGEWQLVWIREEVVADLTVQGSYINSNLFRFASNPFPYFY